jgi:polyhydroxybutyrate depolymerase
MWIEFFLRRLVALGVITLVSAMFIFWLSSPPPRPQVAAAGAKAGLPNACPVGSRVGRADIDEKIKTTDGLRVVVRAPKDYDPTRAYPLIIAFPPAGMNPRRSEVFYDLTTLATERGYIVAYSDHLPLTRQAMATQSKVTTTVQGLFCVDGMSITFLGHSDGGSVAEGLVTFGRNTTAAPQAVVASGAGVTRTDLVGAACPKIPAVMIIHNRTDQLFPDFGRGAAEYWRTCASCAPMDSNVTKSGCREFRNCADGRHVVYCETAAAHSAWPRLNTEIIDFIRQRIP